MGRQDLANKVRNMVGLKADDPVVSNESVYRAINAAGRKMASDHSWPWLVTSEEFTLAQGADTRAFPADYVYTLNILSHGYPLANTQRRQIGMYKGDDIAWGGIARFSTYGTGISFSPKAPAATPLTHIYVRTENVLDSDDDELLCPPAYEDVILTYACIDIATRARDANLRNFFREELDQWKRRIDDQARGARGPMRPDVRRDW